ncbi:glycoside hydrolase family 43 protein [Ceratobasidium sp. AG-Ba]|nr:glycoside hydrolase family 43 protein [Ceratobasidium sp. AG-Ba]QRW02957.1 glycoside hydrolase family 43 protein [Ceratobasidium sp. AG-Ba]
MHYSPGAPILRSYDLFNWEYIGHSVPSLDFGSSAYNLASGTRAYVKGIWASFFGYNSPRKTWYWGGCIGFGKTYIYSSPAAAGPWTQLTVLNKCYYDSGLLVDDDGTMYVSYIYNNNIWVAQLSSDGKSEVKSQQIYVPPSSIGYLEGSRMYKRSGVYYILVTKPASAEYTLKASSPFGSYSIKNLVNGLPSPGGIGGGNPHQGGLVDTPNGQWYYMAFVDAYPGGRIPVLAPVTWGSDGFPTVTLVNGKWGDSYSDPATAHPVSSLTGVDYFTGSSLGPQWEWNHNPDTSKFSVGSGLVLNTATVTSDLYQARNTLSHRILGPISTATIKLSYGAMKDGDRAGLAMLRDSSAWVGVRRDGGAYTVAMVSGLTMDSNWNTASTGSTVASASISGDIIWLRVTADIRPSGTKLATFSYSTDGSSFKSIGNSFAMKTAWEFFMGYRFGIFNYATSALGGKVTVANFQLDSGSGGTPVGGGGSGTPTTSATTSKPPTTTTPSGCTVALYGQCGGQGYTGCTTCASGSKCTYSNDYYSQCL